RSARVIGARRQLPHLLVSSRASHVLRHRSLRTAALYMNTTSASTGRWPEAPRSKPLCPCGSRRRGSVYPSRTRQRSILPLSRWDRPDLSTPLERPEPSIPTELPIAFRLSLNPPR